MDRLEKIKNIKNDIAEVQYQINIGLKNKDWKHVDDCISELKEMHSDLDSLESFDEEAAQMVGGDF
ncbi:MAG: hypothetical protein RR191_05420 [Cetobacterium sp.]|uniref:hypothetical protein n=1 Tax=Cetobacterium sp. TaxID=2071632 RepID=UPI002FC7B540